MKITLSFYRIYLVPKHRKNPKPQIIGNLTSKDPSAKKLIEPVKKILANIPKFPKKGNLNPAQKAEIYHDGNNIEQDNSQASGIIYAGETGFVSEIHNKKTGKLCYSKTVDDIEHLPFYYLIDAPANARNLILCVQNFGNRGMASDFIKLLKERLKQTYPDYIIKRSPIHLGPILFQGIIDKGVLKEIEATEYRKVDNREDVKDGEKMKVTMRYGFDRKGSFLSKITPPIKAHFRSASDSFVDAKATEKLKTTVTSLLSIDIPEGISELSANISVDGTTRKIDLGDINKFATRYDITEDVKKEGGHPVFDNIDKKSRIILNKDIRPLIRGYEEKDV